MIKFYSENYMIEYESNSNWNKVRLTVLNKLFNDLLNG